MYSFGKIGHRIIAGVGLIVALGLIGMVFFYASEQEDSILAQNERAVGKVMESVIRGLETVMLAGYADVAQSYAANLKKVPEVEDFRIMRGTGNEAFQDNKTINWVNEKRGEEDFFGREKEAVIPVLAANNPELVKALKNKETVRYYEKSAEGENLLTFLAPILNKRQCQKCHGKDHEVRGILKLTTTLTPIEGEIEHTWKQSLIVLAVTLGIILLTTNWMIRRTIVQPIVQVTEAMEAASDGDLQQKVPVFGRDELGTMATSFNQMTGELLESYSGLSHERNKLTTIILSAQEGIVVTNAQGGIVLVNPSAELLIGKSQPEIEKAGFYGLFDDPELMTSWLKKAEDSNEPNLHEFKGHKLSILVSTIIAPNSGRIGSAALIRDVTEQMNLEEELRTLSNTDGLTKLFNRRFLDETMTHEMGRAMRYKTQLSVMMFDIDHFKKFNDTHGHDQGDRVLQAIAEVMRETSRDQDFPCRYGGEEFLIIMPNTDLEGGATLAERLRVAVENTPVDGLSVKISIGVASMTDHKPKDGEHFVTLCDGALYTAKDAGRNCVKIAEIPETAES